MKSAFPWPGGKSWAAKYIVPKIPPHACYCEPFAGGVAILLAKEPSPVEIINDINSDVVNFYRCVRFHPDELIKEIQWILSSRREFIDLKEHRGLTDIQRAASWFRIQIMSFGGDGRTYAVGRLPVGTNRSRHRLIERIEALNERLDRVNVEQLDWERCIRLYDGSTTFFFLDPPYLGDSVSSYNAWTIDDLKKLRSVLDSTQGKWLLTMNDASDVRSVFKDCALKKFTRVRGIRNNLGVMTEYAELLICPGARIQSARLQRGSEPSERS